MLHGMGRWRITFTGPPVTQRIAWSPLSPSTFRRSLGTHRFLCEETGYTLKSSITVHLANVQSNLFDTPLVTSIVFVYPAESSLGRLTGTCLVETSIKDCSIERDVQQNQSFGENTPRRINSTEHPKLIPTKANQFLSCFEES